MRQERIRTQFTTPRPDRWRRTRAFTLIELLVVITLIGLLTSILVVASMSVIGTSREAATKATITKVEGMLRPRLEAFNRNYARDVPLDAYTQTQQKYTSLTNDKLILTALTRKEVFRKYFPQTWAEVHDALMITDAEYTQIQNELASAADTSSESAEVLYYMLTSGRAKGYETVSPDAFTSSEVQNLTGSSRPEFIDAWKQPLRFYRWSTRLIRPSGYGNPVDTTSAKILISTLPDATSLAVDPDDPVGVCNSLISMSFTAADFEEKFNTLATYSVPLILSAGPDGLTGLYEPNDATASNRLACPNGKPLDLNDDITNRNMRAGGN